MEIIKYYDLKDFEVFIFDDFIINQVKEGVVFEKKQNERINALIQKHFSGKNMIYVSNRVKSYTVNPLIYPDAAKIPNLVAIAMVPLTEIMKKNAEYERQFYNKPYEIFKTLSDAIRWVNIYLDNNKEHCNSKT